jgi:hypothetical protein
LEQRQIEWVQKQEIKLSSNQFLKKREIFYF